MRRDSVPPLKPEHLSLIGKALKSPLAKRHESRCVLLAQLARESGNDDAVRLGFAAEPRRKLDRRAEEVVALRHWFARVDADPNAQGLGRVGVVGGKSPLDIGGGAHRVRHVVEGGHNAVAGMLDLAPAVRLKPAPDQRVMRPHEFERRAVTETRRHLGRTDDVGEHDGPQPGVYGGGGRTWCRARIADAAEERLDSGKINRNDGVGDFTMGLTMDPLGGRGVRRMDEAEGGAILLIEPIGLYFTPCRS